MSMEPLSAVAAAEKSMPQLPLATGQAAERLCRSVSERFLKSLVAGEMRVTWPSGSEVVYRGKRPGPCADMTIHSLQAIRRIAASGPIGFAEGYIAGEWETSNLVELLSLCTAIDESAPDGLQGKVWSRWINRILHSLRRNTLSGSRRNIAFHYDIGNAFYEKWLDGSMTYSSALFARPEMGLAEAQEAKYRRLASWLDIAPGARVLEIGCGWGGFAIYLAKEHGCHVTGITLSHEQFAHAAKRVRAEGLQDKIELRLQDYRDVRGSFDRIASIEMFEAVGEANWPLYFEQLHALLKPGGLAALQVICIAPERFENYRRDPDFIQRYIFPGGMLPTAEMVGTLAESRGLDLARQAFFGRSYARTLQCWHENFARRWPEIAAMGFDDRFKRTWEYYLDYCTAGFETGTIDVGHFKFVKAAA